MKKMRELIALCILGSMLCGCGTLNEKVNDEKPAAQEQKEPEETKIDDVDGVTIQVVEYCSDSCTIEITNHTENELVYGTAYELEQYEDGAWKRVEYLVDDWAFTDLAYLVKPGETSSQSINWEEFHGSLEDGKYRIIKGISITKDNESKDYTIAATFDIEEEFNDQFDDVTVKKPVIYLYPKEKTKVSVALEYDGTLGFTYPEYKNGWEVIANPDGTLENIKDGKEYSYLFWEGTTKNLYDMSKGFVVKGEDTVSFLQEKLEILGLTPKEYNEFIVYWAPYMENNPYNLITFQTEAYTDHARLNISPKPDSMLRVFMVFEPLEQPIEIEEQDLETFQRNGFSVVEWGGSMIQQKSNIR